MMTMMKISHYQVVLLRDVMDELKELTGERSAKGALTKAVEFTLSNYGGDGD